MDACTTVGVRSTGRLQCEVTQEMVLLPNDKEMK